MRKTLAVVLALTLLYGAVALGNYTATQGVGTNFGSIVVSTVHYAQQFICDMTTPSQCAAVDSSGNVSVNVTTAALPSGAATAALQSAGNVKLDTLIANTAGPIPTQAGTVSIGGLNILGVNATTALAGNGATGTGSLRFTLANDNTIPTGWPTAAGQSAIQPRSLSAAATGGCTPGKTLSAANNNSTLIIAGAHTLCKALAINTSVTLYYLKTYDKATAPTCGTDTPVAVYPIPPSNGGVAVPLGTYGEAYTLGIGFCYVAGLADNDNTSAATGTAINYAYK